MTGSVPQNIHTLTDKHDRETHNSKWFIEAHSCAQVFTDSAESNLCEEEIEVGAMQLLVTLKAPSNRNPSKEE